jgi:hypothetical protein
MPAGTSEAARQILIQFETPDAAGAGALFFAAAHRQQIDILRLSMGFDARRTFPIRHVPIRKSHVACGRFRDIGNA